MNKKDKVNNESSKNLGWKKLGEINNLSGGDIELMQSWLGSIFSPLNLSSKYIDEIIKTAEEASIRVRKNFKGTDIFMHLAVHVPYGPLSKRNTWGLFHMERIEFQKNTRHTLEHSINIYLYKEPDRN